MFQNLAIIRLAVEPDLVPGFRRCPLEGRGKPPESDRRDRAVGFPPRLPIQLAPRGKQLAAPSVRYDALPRVLEVQPRLQEQFILPADGGDGGVAGHLVGVEAACICSWVRRRGRRG